MYLYMQAVGVDGDEIQISADCRGQLNIGCLQTIQVLKSQKKYVTENVANKTTFGLIYISDFITVPFMFCVMRETVTWQQSYSVHNEL